MTTSVPGFTNNCNNPSNVSHTWPACDTAKLFKFRSKKNMKANSQQSFLFRFKIQFKAVSTSYTVQAVSIDLQQYMLNSNTSTTAVQTKDATWCIWEIKINVPKQAVSTCHLTLAPLSTNNLNTKFHCAFSAMTFPISLSLSALQYLYCQANNNASGFNLKVTSQCKHPSSSTVPAHYWTSGVQLFTYYLINVATKPRSLTKQTWPSRFSCQNFSNVATKPRSPTLQVLMLTTISNVATKPRSPTLQVLMPTFLFLTIISRHDARLSSTTHCALRASRINYNLTNLSRCNSFS